MTLLFLIMIQSASAGTPIPTVAVTRPAAANVTAPVTTAAAAEVTNRAPADEAPTGEATSVEFDPTVIEASGGFSGVTAVHVKSDAGSLYTRKIDYTQKIRDSLSEMDELPARGDSQ